MKSPFSNMNPMGTQVYTPSSLVDSSASERTLTGTPLRLPARWATVLSSMLADVIGLVVVGLLSVGILMYAPLDVSFLLAAQILGPAGLLLMMGFGLAGLYNITSRHPAVEMRWAATLAFLTFVAYGVGLMLFAADLQPLSSLILTAGLLAVVVLPLVRGLFRVCCARLPWWGVPTVVFASPAAANAAVTTLKRWPEMGMKAVGVVSTKEEAQVAGVPVIGWDDQALVQARRQGITHVVVSFPEASHDTLLRQLQRYRRIFDGVSVIPAGPDTPPIWTARGAQDGLHGVDIQGEPRRMEDAGKRVLDILLATILLVLLTPLILTIAVLVRCDSKGPIFFRQERMGQKGRLFTLLKFRTMHTNAEEILQDVLERDPDLRAEYEQFHKLQNDPRVTRMGKLLRATSLDELPQLFNVLRGEMSLVGPRAYMPEERPEMNGHHTAILQRPPGITGLWQVAGRNELTFDERVETDVRYAQQWSFWFDLYILVRTVPVVIRGEGAC